MRTRSLLTTLAGTFLLAGAGAGTAFASDAAPSQPSAVPSTPAASAVPSAAPTTSVPAVRVPGALPSTSMSSGQIRVVPSGAPNTGVPATASNGHGEAEAAGAALLVLLGGSGTVLYRRKRTGRG
jgi:hypothetical protein